MFHPQERTADLVLDESFLDIRSRLLDIAATLDRIDTAGDIKTERARRDQIDAAIELLRSPTADRAAAMQLHFSLPYNTDWPRPTNRQS